MCEMSSPATGPRSQGTAKAARFGEGRTSKTSAITVARAAKAKERTRAKAEARAARIAFGTGGKAHRRQVGVHKRGRM